MALILKNCVFLHIPKCGGTTVRVALKRGGVDFKLSDDTRHRTYRIHSYYSDITDQLDGQAVFAICRDPADWYRSFWCHRMRGKPGLPGNRPHEIDHCMCDNFADWVAQCCEDYRGHYTREVEQAISGANSVTFLEMKFLVPRLYALLQEFDEKIPNESGLLLTPRQNVSSSEWHSQSLLTLRIREMIQQSEPDYWDLIREFTTDGCQSV